MHPCLRSRRAGRNARLGLADRATHVILSFNGRGTEEIFHGVDSGSARHTCPAAIWPIARRKLDQLNQAARLADLRSPPANRLEALRGDCAGQHAIRINSQNRLCFHWTSDGPTVEIVDYH
jgi:proteic killer suppression protein